jgi:DNA-binding IclR family transcriptional regulator
MAKRKGKLGSLTPRGREILAFIFNSIAFNSHDDNCDVETLAERLGMKPGTLRRTLAKMTDAGYVTVEGSAEYVYPTVAAFLNQQPDLTEKAATSILKRVHRRG